MENFTPFAAMIGGLLIGAGSLVLLSCNGRVMGIGGILESLLNGQSGLWRLAFLVGMITPIVGAVLLADEPASVLPGAEISGLGEGQTLAVLVISGLLVGFGSRMANGCTSGHAVCGLARLSRRSAAATVVFFAVTALTVYVTRHLI